MEFRYSPDVDILMVKLGDGKFDYAEEKDGVIVHYNQDGIPGLIEIRDAKKFVLGSLASIMQNNKGETESLITPRKKMA